GFLRPLLDRSRRLLVVAAAADANLLRRRRVRRGQADCLRQAVGDQQPAKERDRRTVRCCRRARLPMNVWLLKDGENLPIQPSARKMRMWMLADRLQERGHSVVWWSSTFSHQMRTLLYQSDVSLAVRDRLELRLLHANAYERNVSWARY